MKRNPRRPLTDADLRAAHTRLCIIFSACPRDYSHAMLDPLYGRLIFMEARASLELEANPNIVNAQRIDIGRCKDCLAFIASDQVYCKRCARAHFMER